MCDNLYILYVEVITHVIQEYDFIDSLSYTCASRHLHTCTVHVII